MSLSGNTSDEARTLLFLLHLSLNPFCCRTVRSLSMSSATEACELTFLGVSLCAVSVWQADGMWIPQQMASG